MQLSKEQSVKIQMLRGLAILAVVFIHNTPAGIEQVLCRPFINFSVGLFLFLSGMLSTAQNWNPKKRIMKVIIPYILWSMVYTVLYNYKVPKEIIVLFLKNLITGKAAAIMYYIFVYCQFTLLIPWIDKLAKSKWKYVGFVITPVEIILMRTLPLLTGYEMNKGISVIMGISCLGWFSFFYLGYLLGNDRCAVNLSKRQLWGCILIALILQMSEGYYYYLLGDANCGTQLKLSAVLTGIVVCIIAYKHVISDKIYDIKWLCFLGDVSFGVYFSHLAVMVVLRKLPFYSEVVRYPINALVVVAISCFVVWIGRKILKRYAKLIGF